MPLSLKAHGRLPFLLLLRGLPCFTSPFAGRLLRLLQLRLAKVPFDATKLVAMRLPVRGRRMRELRAHETVQTYMSERDQDHV